MSEAGAALFARYAYPPNALGYCGPAGADALLDHESGSHDAVAAHARQFEGAWHYLDIIAAAAGRSDPLDVDVVEAYWVGNDLLDEIAPTELVEELLRRLPGQVGGSWTQARERAVAHHGFHVFEVYPWVGLLGNGSPVPLSVLDRCRIRAGEVVSLAGDHADVRLSPLLHDRSGLAIGTATIETVRWAENGRSFTGQLQVGEAVAVHWDWVCDRLTQRQSDALAQQTHRQLDLVNREVLGLLPQRPTAELPQ